MSMDIKKERITELNHRQKVRFSTLLLPVLVTWNTLDTRGSTASHRHIAVLNSCNSYPWTLFGSPLIRATCLQDLVMYLVQKSKSGQLYTNTIVSQ